MANLHPTFLELPLELKESIFGLLDLKMRSRLRKCCKDLKFVIDNMPLHYFWVQLSVYAGYVRMMVVEDEKYQKRTYVTYENRDFVENVMRDLNIIINNPNIAIQTFNLEIWIYFPNGTMENSSSNRNDHFFTEISKMLKPLNNSPKIKVFSIKHQGIQEHVLSILPFLTPEKIQLINHSWENSKIQLDEILKLEQCKKAKSFETRQFITDLSIDKFYNFEIFHVEVEELLVKDLGDVVKTFFNSKTSLEWNITHWGDQKPLLKWLRTHGSPLEDRSYEKWILKNEETNDKIIVTVCTSNVSNYIVGPREKHRLMFRRF